MKEALQRAQEKIAAGDNAAAIEIYEGLLDGVGNFLQSVLTALCALYLGERRFSKALSAGHALTYFAPKDTQAWLLLYVAQEKLGLQDAALATTYRILEMDQKHLGSQQTRLSLLAAKLEPGDYRLAAEAWYQSLPRVSCYAHRAVPKQNLRVGYVSADFRHHVMDRFIEPLLEYSSLDVWCFDNSPKHDEKTEQLKAIPGVTWRSITELDDAAAAEAIHAEGIDILVDLNGLTGGNRLGVFRRHPAPVQITGIGFLPTTGADCFDWRLADVEDQDQYTEPLWKLPTAASPLPLCPELTVSPLPALVNGYVTFGYVNGLRKLTPACIKTFIEVIQAVPNSKLLMMLPGVADAETAVSLLRRFDPIQDRIIFTESNGGWAFAKLFSCFDIALDPWPYGGCTTSLDTLFHGVPIVSQVPDRRLAADAVRLQGFDGFANQSYVDKAVHLARDIPRLAATRRLLRQRVLDHPAGKPREWVASLGAAYRSMYQLAAERKAA